VRRLAFACGAAVAAALVFGGTSRGGFPGAVVGLAALPLAILLFDDPKEWMRGRMAALALVALAVATPLLQLVPLPPSLWSSLPGRRPLVETYGAAGLALPWLPVSVGPYATERAVFALLTGVVIFLGALACRREERRMLLALALVIGGGSALLEFLQIIDGPDSALRFYRPSDGNVGVGLFANRNHAAAMLYCMIPIAAVVFDPGRSRRPMLSLAALGGYDLMIVLGLMMTGSRSALIFGCAALIVSSVAISRESVAPLLADGRRMALFALAGLGLVAALLAPAFGLTHILDRLVTQEAGAGDRVTLARVSFEAARSFFPIGSGLGTFERVYPLFEPREAIAAAIINHAHDDVLELALETGVLGVALVAGALALAIHCVARNRSEPDAGLRRERDAAAIVLALLFLHSLLDYPLRMPALAALFALCAATLCKALDDRRRGRGHASG
jgi:hypothetical protein